MRLIALVELHTLFTRRFRLRRGCCVPFVGMSLALLPGSVSLSLVEPLDECASMTINVIALVLPEAHLLALGALSKYLLLY